MNYKKFALFILTVITFGWLGNLYVDELVNDKIKKSNYEGKLKFDVPYMKFIKFPFTVFLIVMFYLLAIAAFWILSSVFGYWFVYTFLGIMLVMTFIIVPVTLYLTIDEIVQDRIDTVEFLPEPKSKYDKYFYKRFDTN